MTTLTKETEVATQTLRSPRKGLILMMCGIALFSILNGVVKAQSALFPINQIVFFRNSLALIPLAVLLQTLGGVKLLRTRRVVEQILLAVVFTTVLFGFFAAYSMMPLADVTAIAFTQPLIVTMLALPFTGERVRRVEWIAVLIGLGGILLMVQPSGNGSLLGAGLALGASFFSAMTMILQRRLSRTEASIAITFWTLAISALMMVPTLAFSWVNPTGPQWIGLIAMGLASGCCQYLTVRAFYHASPATIAPITYTKMFWAIAIGFIWFQEIPTLAVIIGAGVVIGSTLLVFRSSPSSDPVTPIPSQQKSQDPEPVLGEKPVERQKAQV